MSSTTRNYVVAAPAFLYGFRIAQLVVALVILGLCAYGIRWYSFNGDSLMLFTAIATVLITVYIGVASVAVPVIYNYWAILGLDVFAVIFWVISFSLLASEVAYYSSTIARCAYYWDGVCYHKEKRSTIAKRDTTSIHTYKSAMAAAAGLGGLEFLLFAITLVIFSIHLMRHRKAGGRSTPNSAAPAVGIDFDTKHPEAQQNIQPTQYPVQEQPQQHPVQQ